VCSRIGGKKTTRGKGDRPRLSGGEGGRGGLIPPDAGPSSRGGGVAERTLRRKKGGLKEVVRTGGGNGRERGIVAAKGGGKGPPSFSWGRSSFTEKFSLKKKEKSPIPVQGNHFFLKKGEKKSQVRTGKGEKRGEEAFFLGKDRFWGGGGVAGKERSLGRVGGEKRRGESLSVRLSFLALGENHSSGEKRPSSGKKEGRESGPEKKSPWLVGGVLRKKGPV